MWGLLLSVAFAKMLALFPLGSYPFVKTGKPQDEPTKAVSERP